MRTHGQLDGRTNGYDVRNGRFMHLFEDAYKSERKGRAAERKCEKNKMWKVRGKALSVLNYVMMTHVKMEVKLHIFLNPLLDGNEFSAFLSDRLITGNY